MDKLKSVLDYKGIMSNVNDSVLTWDLFDCSLCNGFAWDQDGDILGIIFQSSQFILWDANTEKKQTIDIGLRDNLTYMVWAKIEPILAIGTSKGNVSIYNHNTSRYIIYISL